MTILLRKTYFPRIYFKSLLNIGAFTKQYHHFLLVACNKNSQESKVVKSNHTLSEVKFPGNMLQSIEFKKQMIA